MIEGNIAVVKNLDHLNAAWRLQRVMIEKVHCGFEKRGGLFSVCLKPHNSFLYNQKESTKAAFYGDELDAEA